MIKPGLDSYLSITQSCARWALTHERKIAPDRQLSKWAATVDRMAVCPDCRREMRLAPSCVTTVVLALGDKTFDRVPHPASAAEGCDSCGVKPGGVHHFGCDMERCPSCGGQLLMCAG